MKRNFLAPDSFGYFNRRRQSTRQHTREQKGSIMVLTAVALMSLVGMLALAVDLGYLFSARAQLQNGINAAALAAGAGLRVTIEGDLTAPQQELIAKELGVIYAGQNQVRLFSDPPEDSDEPSRNNLVIKPEDVIVELNTPSGLPRVRVKAIVQTPMLFAGAFGLYNVDIGATATASLIPVDGGTGTISSGSQGAGCWRPLFLPDTFYDTSNTPLIVGEEISAIPRVPREPGDYYRSRFAVGARNAPPFYDLNSILGTQVTGLRDTSLKEESGVATIMGKPDVIFKSEFYRIANFSGLSSDGSPTSSTLQGIASFGYCGKIRVGDDIPVYAYNDLAAYDQVKAGLLALRGRTVNGDFVDSEAESQFGYVKSAGYPEPNTFGAIIPVLFYNPMVWRDPDSAKAITMFKVTNYGLFCLKEVLPNGDIRGFFVREIISGGTPIESTNLGAESAAFNRRWLPMSVQLLK